MARPRRPSGRNTPPPLLERLADYLNGLPEQQRFYPVQFSSRSKPRLTFGHRVWQWDDEIENAIVRKRGERGKLAGAILIEEIAIELLREREDSYKPQYERAGGAQAQALIEVASMFGIGTGTLEDWKRGIRRRERRRPIEERSFRRRKQKKHRSN